MDGQMLEITSIPIKLDITVNRAQLSPIDTTESPAAVQAKSIKSPAEMRILMDNARNKDVFVQSSDNKIELSYNAVAKISRQPENINAMVSKTGELDEIYRNSNLDDVMTKAASASDKNMSWQNGTLSLKLSSEEIGMKFEPDTVGFEFTPGSIDITVEQFPQVKIEYIGDPIYIPFGKGGFDTQG